MSDQQQDINRIGSECIDGNHISCKGSWKDKDRGTGEKILKLCFCRCHRLKKRR